jgi:hypothetical protein
MYSGELLSVTIRVVLVVANWFGTTNWVDVLYEKGLSVSA